MEPVRYLTRAASEAYEEVEFLTDDLYNKPPPRPWVAFMIGLIFWVIGVVLWYIRVQKLKKLLGVPLVGALRLRAWSSAFIDNDSASYTIIKMSAQSFLFLGGLQLNYSVTFSVMLGYFALESGVDSVRVLLAFMEANSVSDVVVTSSTIRTKLRNQVTQLKPSNVYEDLSRHRPIVFMVFVTQAVLISFVVTDIFNTETHSCLDKSQNCPVVGTLGSWGFYILGIFMACVFLLGPKTSFGQSEQNPAYWLKLLLCAKSGSKCSWYDPTDDVVKTSVLRKNDWRIWVRFLMSFLINGVGFHILVHALPIQVAGQSSLTGVVFRAVGMMYLVDLDDTPGYTLTLVEDDKIKDDGKDDETANNAEDSDEKLDEGEVATQADKIIQDAQAQLDALSAGQGITRPKKGGMSPGAALVLAGGMSTAAGLGAINEEDVAGDEEAAETSRSMRFADATGITTSNGDAVTDNAPADEGGDANGEN